MPQVWNCRREAADREGLRKTCFGTFSVLAALGSLGGRFGRLAPANACRRCRRTRVRSPIPIRQYKSPHFGELFIGGQRGIRTLERLSPLHTFQACAFNHSATCPAREKGKYTPQPDAA